jgi:hypothetical protein
MANGKVGASTSRQGERRGRGGGASAQGDSALDVLTFGIGGYAGGALGARLPDIIEPAVHSHHRNV